MLLRPQKEARGPARRASSAGSTACFGRAHRRLRRRLPPPDPQGRRGDAAPRRASPCSPGCSAARLPASFVPDEDQGYFYIDVQLPDGARCSAPTRSASRSTPSCKDTPGVQTYNTVAGFSLLSGVNTTYSGFYFVTLEPWDERDTAGPHRGGDHARAQPASSYSSRRRRRSPSRRRPFPASARRAASPSCSRTAAGQDVEFLAQNTDDVPRRGAQAAGARTACDRPSPRRAAALRRRRPRQGAQAGRRAERRLQDAADVPGRRRSSTTSTASAGSGGSSCRPRASYRTQADDIGQFYVRNSKGEMVPLSALVDMQTATGPEFTMRYNLYRAAQINASAKPGYSSGQAHGGARGGLRRRRMPREMGYDYIGHVVPGAGGRAGRVADVIFGFSLAVRVPHPGGAVRELVAAVQRPARHADRRLRRLRGALAARTSTTTSTRRSAWSC